MKNILFIFLSACILQSCCTVNKIPNKNTRAVAGIGLSGTKDGGSWDPTLGGLLGIETQVLSCNTGSSVFIGFLLLMQGAAYTEMMETMSFNEATPFKSTALNENEFSGKISLTYIDFPLMYNYQSENGFYAEIGLQPGFLISAKDKYDGGSYNYKDNVKSFELGLPVGVGYRINEQFSVGARACYGLSNANNVDNGDKDHNYTVFGVVRYNLGSLITSKK